MQTQSPKEVCEQRQDQRASLELSRPAEIVGNKYCIVLSRSSIEEENFRFGSILRQFAKLCRNIVMETHLVKRRRWRKPQIRQDNPTQLIDKPIRAATTCYLFREVQLMHRTQRVPSQRDFIPLKTNT